MSDAGAGVVPVTTALLAVDTRNPFHRPWRPISSRLSRVTCSRAVDRCHLRTYWLPCPTTTGYRACLRCIQVRTGVFFLNLPAAKCPVVRHAREFDCQKSVMVHNCARFMVESGSDVQASFAEGAPSLGKSDGIGWQRQFFGRRRVSRGAVIGPDKANERSSTSDIARRGTSVTALWLW